MNALFLTAAALCIITAFIHSYFGEQRLLSPLIGSNHGVMSADLAKQVVRFAWHWTSLLWILVALYLISAALSDNHSHWLVLLVGVVHLVAGCIDGIITKGKHIGWPPITLIGVLVFLGILV